MTTGAPLTTNDGDAGDAVRIFERTAKGRAAGMAEPLNEQVVPRTGRSDAPVVVSQKHVVSIAVDVLQELAKNAMMRVPAVRALRLRRPRAGAQFTGACEELERYAFQSVRSLLGTIGSIRGLDIVEFGPGDSLTSGFALLAAGAKSYTVIDRFPGDYTAARSKEWYRGIQSHWSDHFPEISWPSNLDASMFPEEYGQILHVMSQSIEMAEPTLQFDVVCSYQVGEHVNELASFASMTARLLRDDGVAVHRVDFGPHDCWLRYSDPLMFLRFPGWLWSLMGSNRGYPNRHRHREFLRAFEDAELKVSVQGIETFESIVTPAARPSGRVRRGDSDPEGIKTAIYVCRPKSVRGSLPPLPRT